MPIERFHLDSLNFARVASFIVKIFQDSSSPIHECVSSTGTRHSVALGTRSLGTPPNRSPNKAFISASENRIKLLF